MKRSRGNTLQDRPANKKKLSQCVFSTAPLSKFQGPFPYFRKPTEVGSFSQDNHRQFRHDRSQLRCFTAPSNWSNVSYDLRLGYETFDKRDESVKDFINDMLRWVQLNKKKFQVPGLGQEAGHTNSLYTDFICWRGLLTRLLCTPYEQREDWLIAVTLYNGTYYMCEFETERKLQQRAEQTDLQAEMTYWGLKFEQYVTAETAESKPDTASPVTNKAGFCSVVRSRLNKHSLVFGGEVDCCEWRGKQRAYVELKTSREIYHQRQDTNFRRYKLIKWWAQSFLIGIDKIVCGFRDDDGVVQRLEAIQTNSVSKLCSEIPNPWEPSICFNFLDHFLQFIKDTVKTDDPRVTYVLSWKPGQSICCEEYGPNSQYAFLPEWYYNTADSSGST